MKFKRLEALYNAGANVHYDGKLCEIISHEQVVQAQKLIEEWQRGSEVNG